MSSNQAISSILWLAVLIGMVPGVLHDLHQSRPRLLSRWDDLTGRQEEAVTAGVPQLESVGVLDTNIIGPVYCGTTSWV